MMPIVQIVAKATVTAALGLIAAGLARRQRAAARHILLAATFGVLLVLPAASLIAPPIRIAVPVAAVRPSIHRAIETVASVSLEDERTAIAPAAPPSSIPSAAELLTVGWIAGTLLSLLPMVLGLWKMRSLRRSGLPWLDGQSVLDRLAREAGVSRRVEVLLHESLSGPMTCGVRHPAVMLSPHSQKWEQADLHRAMVHELEHVRRGDYLSHCLARAVCAMYWFHPLVWMAWRQLALEAERACDDAVLGRCEAADYADQLVALARRMSMASKSPLLAMANRADLAARVGAVLDGRQRRGRAGAVPVAMACLCAAALALAMSPVRIVAAPQFAAVSVKLVDANAQGEHSHEDIDPGRLHVSGTMHRFVLQAYGITDGQLGGEPDWFKGRLYSIDAVTDTPADQNHMMIMLRGVLEERFQLKLRQEDRELPVYALEVAAGGPKFKELKAGEEPIDPPDRPGILARSFSSMQELIASLNGFGGRLSLDRTVLDRTRLAGNYNIQLQTEIEAQTDDAGHRTIRLPNLPHDIQSQLGLKLVSDRVKMPYFVVEHAAAPTPN